MSSNNKSSCLSFSYGEKTSIPIELRKAVFDIPETPTLPFLQNSLCCVELTVVNTVVEKDIAAKLKLALPPNSSVKKFEMLRRDDGLWYPATAVPKQQAAAIVYKEKEKNRDVAAVSNFGSTNVFEIEISPLPYEIEVKCRLEILLPSSSSDTEDVVKKFIESLSPRHPSGDASSSSTEIVVNYIKTSLTTTTTAIGGGGGCGGGGAIVGDSFGKTHFVCSVPPPVLKHLTNDNDTKEVNNNEFPRIAILHDTSASMEPTSTQQIMKRCDQIKQLWVKANTVQVELYCFDTTIKKVGLYDDVDELVKAIGEFSYDGGSLFAPIPDLLTDLASRNDDSNNKVDCVLVFSDGVDSLGKIPNFDDNGRHNYDIPYVHCIANTDDASEVNLKCLRRLASASLSFPGTVFTTKDGKDGSSFVDGILAPGQPVLRSIRTDQDDAAFVEEIDDGFRCVPDHRLGVLNHPIGDNGLLISGILKQDGQIEPSTVSKIVAEVVLPDGAVHEFHFQLRKGAEEAADNGGGSGRSNAAANRHFLPAVHFFSDETEGEEKPAAAVAGAVDQARILGHIYAEELYNEAESFGLKSGMDTRLVQQELAVSYGFCSPESSLLMLYDIEQFSENKIKPGIGHPLHEKLAPNNKDDDNTEKDPIVQLGDIGGPKTDAQKAKVFELGNRLQSFFQEEIRHGRPEKRSRVERMQMDMRRSDGYDDEEDGCMGGDGGHAEMPSFRSAGVVEVRQQGMVMGPHSARGDRPERARGADVVEVPSAYAIPYSARGERRERTRAVMMCSSADASPQSAGGERRERVRAVLMRPHSAQGDRPERARVVMEGAMPDVIPPEADRGIPGNSSRFVGQPQDMKTYMDALEQVLSDGKEEDWENLYEVEKKKLGRFRSASPSFFLNTASVLVKHGKNIHAIRVVTNCLESGIEDVQMLRSVGYMLLSTNASEGMELSINVFDKVRELSPCEPQSFLDSALARFFKLSKAFSPTGGEVTVVSDIGKFIQEDLIVVQELLSHVLTHRWADRFDEVEWPALILLHYVADFVQEIRKCNTQLNLPEWPSELVDAFKDSSGSTNSQHPLRCANLDICLMVWLGWDTDKTDVDLHVKEPSGQEVYYSHKRGAGSLLSRDFTRGYGPEVYVLKSSATKNVNVPGEFEIYAKYYASHQDSKLTGTTSAVVWTIEKVEGKKMMKFRFVRLDSHKQKTRVATAVVLPA